MSILVPSSKSHTIRALLTAAHATGSSTITNALDSADAASCIAAIGALGVEVEVIGRTATGIDLTVTPPVDGIKRSAPIDIDVGNSGTTLYLLTALAALRPYPVSFTGDGSIRRRSAGHLLSALTQLGATISGGDAAPYRVVGPLLPGREITIESPTSQFLSALLLTAPLIDDPEKRSTTINVALLNEHPYVDMTCWWLDLHNVQYRRDRYNRFSIPAHQRYHPISISLPGDFSSATFWFCAAAITGSPVTVRGLHPEDVQGDRGVLEIFEQLGCSVVWSPAPSTEKSVSSVTVTGPLKNGGTFDLNAMPDALPALAVAACFAPEPIRLTNVPQAREKETDRIAVMAQELSSLGCIVRELPDGLEIEPRVPRGGTINSHGDHRIAMAFAVAALGADAAITIEEARAAAVTYPSFFDDLTALAPGKVVGRTNSVRLDRPGPRENTVRSEER